jgi:hypothetical protein
MRTIALLSLTPVANGTQDQFGTIDDSVPLVGCTGVLGSGSRAWLGLPEAAGERRGDPPAPVCYAIG